MSDDLVTWLRVQLDDHERMARAAQGVGRPWHFDFIDEAAQSFVDLALSTARVLAEVDAKRLILDDLATMDGDPVNGLVVTHMIRTLALPYADRSGYREEWRP